MPLFKKTTTKKKQGRLKVNELTSTQEARKGNPKKI